MVLANQVIGQNMSTQLTNMLLSNTAVKITGYNGEKSLAIIAKKMGAELSELKSLTTGRFCGKENVAGRVTQAFAFKAPGYLIGNKQGLKRDAWLVRIKQGWPGYIPNDRLDQVMTKTAPESPSESLEGVSVLRHHPRLYRCP